MKRLMLITSNNVLGGDKITGPYPADPLQAWVDRQRSESALGYVTWEVRELTEDEDRLPTATYVLKY